MFANPISASVVPLALMKREECWETAKPKSKYNQNSPQKSDKTNLSRIILQTVKRARLCYKFLFLKPG
jgi:hypothetical protein